MRILADTNIVARIAQPAHHHHQAALRAVETVIARNDDPCMVPQVLYEFWVVATKPASANGLALTMVQAEAEITKARSVFTLLRDERTIFDHWERLVVKYDVRGKSAHDARLVAAMVRHNVSYILTFNAQDFTRYGGITVLSPEAVIQANESRSTPKPDA